MKRLHASPRINNQFSTLGKIQGDNYTIEDRALDILNDIDFKLTCEDQTLRTFRRTIGLAQYVKTDLIPFLVNVKDHKLIDTIIRILVNLTVPLECLFSIEIMMRTEAGRHTVSDLSCLLTTSKESFNDVRAMRAVVDHMKNTLDKDLKLSTEQCDSVNNCLLLVRNILHIPEKTNGRMAQSNHFISMQNQIVWNLFTLSIDKLLIYLMSCPQRTFWSVTMVQLIAVMYRDQHDSTLQKLLNVWLEDSLSDSSEDFESNTSTPQDGSGDSTPMLISDPTSSDDGGGISKVEAALCLTSQKISDFSASMSSRHKSNGVKQVVQPCSSLKPPSPIQSPNTSPSAIFGDSSSPSKTNNTDEIEFSQKHLPKGKFSSTSKLSDCGYATQVENQESISTSSNEDSYPCQKIHQKPPCNQKQRYNAVNNPRSAITAQEKKDWRRKKLVKRGKTILINMKGLLHHKPSDEDISNILKEFTIDFLLKGYGNLVQDLYAKLLAESDLQNQIDTSDFFWLINYFLKFAAQLELDLDHIKCVLSFNIVSYLTYEAVSLYEQLELTSRQQEMDIQTSQRRMHLVVTAIREFLQALNTYNNVSHLSQDDINYIRLLQLQISVTEDLRHLFILLIKNYNPLIQSKQYLQDLIVTNHILLIIPDKNHQKLNESERVKLMEHIEQFATVEIMQQYGLLLENYYENGEFVNDCIFTLMHHISGDLGQVTSLFQPSILKTYSQIWETEYELCDDWSDLIEYVIHKFINTPQKSPLKTLPPPSLVVETTVKQESEDEFCDDVWSKDEIDILYWHYEQSKSCTDTVGQIIKLFSESGYKAKYRITVIQQMLQQDIITSLEYNDLMKYEHEEYERNFKSIPFATEPITTTGIDSMVSSERSEKPNDDIQILKDKLLKENKGKQILWLQKILVEYCFAKLCFIKKEIISKTHNNGNNGVTVIEPISHHCILKRQSVPLVPWNAEQNNILLYQPFILLLHKLGFQLPADSGKLFVRIPEFWTADILFDVAEKLGPIEKSFLKFDVKELNTVSSTPKNVSNENIERNVCGLASYDDTIIKKCGSNTFSAPPNVQNMNSTISTPNTIPSTTTAISMMQLNTSLPIKRRKICNDLRVDAVESAQFPFKATVAANDKTLENLFVNEHNEYEKKGVYEEMEDDDASLSASVSSDLMCVSDEEDKIEKPHRTLALT